MRVYRSESPNLFDKGISILSYYSLGVIGFIWMIVCHIAGKPPMPFAKYHIIQSIFIGICITLFQIILSILVNALSIIPFLANLILNLIFFITAYPLIFGISILKIFILSFAIYIFVTIAKSQYTEIPWFSDMVKKFI